MATKAGGGSGDITDDDLLGGSDDDNTTSVLDGLDDDAPEPQNEGSDTHLQADPGDDLEIEILDSDEGSDPDQGDRNADASADDLNPDTSEDTGEEIGQDFLTDWEKRNYSKAMQGRVTRERRLKKTAEDSAVAERNGRIAAETRALQAEKVTVQLLVSTFDREIRDKTAELIKAKEEADTAKEVALSDEITELRMKKRDAETAKARLDSVPDPAAAANGQPAANPLAVRWLGRNRWMANDAFSAEAAEARRIDKEIFAEGRLRPDTPEYFAEMDRRIKRNLPNLQTRVKAVFGDATGQQRPGKPGAGAQPAVRRTAPAGGGGSRPNRVTITPADKANMRRFGLDPNDKKALREYALNKVRGN